MIKKMELQFLGFNLPQRVKKDFSSKYPTDKKQLSLKNWNDFEINNEGTFREMYQFWLKRKL